MKYLAIAFSLSILWIISAQLGDWHTAHSSEGGMQRVSISQTLEHPALNQTYAGIVDALNDAGFIIGENLQIDHDVAQGSPVLAVQIAQHFISQAPDVVVGIGTTSAQAFVPFLTSSHVPLVFSSVTDPKAAGLVLQAQITGVSNFFAVEPQLKMYRTIMPELKTLGVIYNPGEDNSVTLIGLLQDAAKKLGITIRFGAASRSADVAQATESLIREVDAIFVTNDNTALAAFESIVGVSLKEGKPVFVSDTDMTEKGALASYGPNQYEIGRQTGKMIAALLKGQSITGFSIDYPQKIELHINQTIAQKLGVVFSETITKKAVKIYE